MKERYKLLLIPFLLFFSNIAFAQGSVEGIVLDSLSGNNLVGANVFLVGTALGSSTDLDGHYQINNIPDGNYKVRVSYIGYGTKTTEVAVRGKVTVILNITLPPQVVQGKEVVVTAQLKGQTQAINQQLTSNTIVNVVSEEKIQQLPDANAAEAIGRLPGISVVRSGGEADRIVIRGMGEQFSTITVDGFRMASTDSNNRSVDLSEISQSSLAGIELYKAVTSDMDGDAIAGSVNFLTRKAPSKRLLWVDAKGVYNGLDNDLLKNQYNLALRYGERFFNNVLGVQLGGDLEQLDRSDEKYALAYNTDLSNGTDYQINNFTLDYINELRKRNGGSVFLDINTPDSGTIRINNIYNETSRNFIDYNRNYPTDNSMVGYGARDRNENISSYNSSIRGDNNLFGLVVDWGAGFAQSKAYYPFDYELDFTEPSLTDSTGNVIAGMYNVPSSVLKGPPQAIIPYAANNFQRAYLYSGYSRFEKNLEIDKSAFVDISKRYTIGSSVLGDFKFGGKYRANTRSKDLSELLAPYYLGGFPNYVKLPDGTVELKSTEFAGTSFANLQRLGNLILVTNFLSPTPSQRNLYGTYTLNPMLDESLLQEWYDLNINGVNTSTGTSPEYNVDEEVAGNHYDITERVSAGYAMNTLKLGQLATFITGVRVESENNDYESKYSPGTLGGFPTPVGTLRDTSSSHQEAVWLPNFQFLYKPLDFMNVRLAAYRALARPDFNMRLNTFISRATGTFYSGNDLTVGNPGLRDAKAWNYEANLSFFSNTIGLFSVSAFYKNITDMFHMLNGAEVNGQHILDSLGIKWKDPFNNDYGLNYPYNSSKPTYVWGFEVEHQANFLFLPGLLQNIILSYNFSFVRSQTYIMATKIVIDTVYVGPFPQPRPRAVLIQLRENLEQQPQFFGNVALGYDYRGFSVRISLYHQGQYTSQYSADGKSDLVVNGYTRLDLAVKQKITDNVSFMLDVNNLTDVREGTAQANRITGWTLPLTSERYGLTGDAGIRVSL